MATSAPPTHLTRAYAAWLIVCLVWGTTYLFIRIALETVPPMLMAGMRWVAAGAILTLAAWVARQRFPPLRSWPALALIGLLMTTIGIGAVVYAELTVPSGLAALLVAAIPFWMVAIERAMPAPEQLRPVGMIGLTVGFGGILLLVWPDLQGSVGTTLRPGIAATQFACIGWALGSSYSRRRTADGGVIAVAAIQMLCGGMVLLVFGAIRGEWAALSFTPRTAAAVAYLIVAGSVVAFSAYLYALMHLPVTIVSLYAYVNPVIAVALGTAVLDEPFSPRLVVAGAIVVMGMVLVRRN